MSEIERLKVNLAMLEAENSRLRAELAGLNAAINEGREAVAALEAEKKPAGEPGA